MNKNDEKLNNERKRTWTWTWARTRKRTREREWQDNRIKINICFTLMIPILKVKLPTVHGVVSYVRKSYVRMFIAAKNFCANVHRSESSYVRKCISAKVHTRESAYVRKFILAKVHKCESS